MKIKMKSKIEKTLSLLFVNLTNFAPSKADKNYCDPIIYFYDLVTFEE